MELRRQRRAHQQSKDCGLAMILVSTVTTFFMLHTPRLLVSVYEAANFNYQEHCESISRDYFPLWFTCSVAAVNFSLVSYF